MEEISILNEQNVLGHRMTIYGTLETPLFLAKDVAQWIEHSDVSTMMRNVDENEKVTNIICTPGGTQTAWFLTEDGLYEVLMLSRKPVAKEFKKQVKAILKSIRLSGGYIANQENLSESEIMAKALLVANNVIERQKQALEQKEQRIEAMKPKEIFADAVSTSKTSILIGDLAKLISQNGVEIGQIRLFDYLRNNGYLMKNGTSRNLPTQKYMEMGLFEIKESTVQNPDGSVRINRTTKVTGKGQIYFVNKFLKERN